jgi:putative Holliday junction resolvase
MNLAPISSSGGGVVVALDHGAARVGVAASDELRMFAHPVATLENDARLLERIRRIVEERRATLVLVGLPLNMDGTDSDTTRRVRAFRDKLASAIAVPVEFRDERLTSFAADETLASSTRKKRRDKGERDRRAAAVMLQEYLDGERQNAKGKMQM